jgi:hypothetical protein
MLCYASLILLIGANCCLVWTGILGELFAVFIVVVRTGSFNLLHASASSLLHAVNAFRPIVDCLIRVTCFLAGGCIITGCEIAVVVLLLVESMLIIVVNFAEIIERPATSCIETEFYMLVIVSSECPLDLSTTLPLLER